MDPTLLFFLCLLAPISTSDVPAESVAILNLQQCLEFAPTRQHDMGILSTDIEVTDREAKTLLNHQKKMESLSKRENATELDHLNAKVAKLEFEAFRQHQQARLKVAEEAMFKKWHKQVNAAVKLVAQREAITVVLCRGTDLNEIEASANRLQQTHVGFVHDQTRPDITDKIVDEMKTAAFLESVEKENSKRAQ
jgi:Skp family chaperone for outer membrane proteins